MKRNLSGFITLAVRAAQCHERYPALAAELMPDAQAPPDFHSRPLRTFYTEMPVYDVADFIASW